MPLMGVRVISQLFEFEKIPTDGGLPLGSGQASNEKHFFEPEFEKNRKSANFQNIKKRKKDGSAILK